MLLRHRAILFGLLGSFILYSGVKPALRPLACVAALIAMASFLLLVWSAEGVGQDIKKVALADVIGLVALFFVWVIEVRKRQTTSPT